MAQKNVKIEVLKTDGSNMSNFKVLYRNTIVCDESITFDYDLIERALLLLYPDSLIHFTVGKL